MMKTNKIKTSYIIIGVCLLVVGALFSYLFTNVFGALGGVSGQGTVLEFKSDSMSDNGFNREATVYTENGITGAVFSGKITVDGTAVISIIDDAGSIMHSETYTSITSGAISFEVNGLSPYTYYILRFSSSDAKHGHLILTTDQSLVESPEVPERPARPAHDIH